MVTREKRREGAGGIAKRGEGGRKEVGMGSIVEQRVEGFIAFRGTVDLVVRIGKLN